METVPTGSVPAEVVLAGQAARDAGPAAGRFPLLVISHGFLNRALMFSDLGERLASKGYVVAVIDHGDLADNAVSRELAFLKTVFHRAADQRLVMAEIARRAAGKDGFWSHVDAGRVALAGYSMGGFGALATAGAGYDAASPLFGQAAPGTAALLAATPPPPANLKAVIAFAPWGGGQPLRAFSAAGLGRITLPTLFIAGDEDDVADYKGGIRWLFEQSGGPRYMLTYENARHNVASNATPPELAHRFEYRERQDEPVWRKDRMLAINTHMITAFLDWHLKSDAAARRWLDVPMPRAVDGSWPATARSDAGARTDGPPSYWPGFQRRWAVGLRMEKLD
ncbi:alpha/beta hydrolase family protein [Polymorphobacter multimanifer]|uniref:alpha/beta hydrolase family protein n=1 Tax=Polymorphobacter multimanifer TaxID=1070431 RepID=UPI0016674F42|nr:dienelactone hydrolase family protein [Polymorphobacter multimanifer]